MILSVSTSREPYFEGVKVLNDCYILCFTCMGSGVKKVGDDLEIPLSPGTIVCTPPNVMLQSFSETGMVDIVIYTTSFSLAKKSGNGVVVLQDDQVQSARTLFSLLHRVHDQHLASLDNFMENIYQNLEEFLTILFTKEKYDPRIAHITDVLIERFSEPGLSIDEVFGNEPYCNDYLRRIFKKTHGCTPASYVNRLRIDKAKKLLRGNCLRHESITAIASNSGFSDVSYFSRVFRNATGYSPTQYEKLFPGAVKR